MFSGAAKSNSLRSVRATVKETQQRVPSGFYIPRYVIASQGQIGRLEQQLCCEVLYNHFALHVGA